MHPPLLSGLVAAPFTPMTGDGALNLARVPELAAALHRHKVSGAFICGTTGEGTSLTSEERERVAEAWAMSRPAGLTLIVHVGHNSLREAARFARHAEKIGADAFAMLPPSGPRPANLDDLIACCAYVAAAAPNLGFYYYHMPAMSGVNVPMVDFIAAAADRIPNFRGVKFTYEHMMDFNQALRFDPTRFAVLHGRDETLLAGLALGSKGAVGSTYNFAAPVYQRLIKAFAAGDLETARREQAQAIRYIEILVRNGGFPAFKTVMRLIGLDCGGMRLPYRDLDAAMEKKLHAELDAAGFFAAVK